MRKERISEVVITYIILILVSFIFFFPVLWLVMASFSATGSIYDYDGFFPKSFSTGTYYKLFNDTAMYDYPAWLRNTLFVSACSCILSTVLVILTAYTMSRFKFKMRKPLMKTTLVLSMFPSFMGMTATCGFLFRSCRRGFRTLHRIEFYIMETICMYALMRRRTSWTRATTARSTMIVF